ncbi:hypothetical protein ANO11243_042110 [Dothideomycetidae sp. 11243]|nr:hypothetical protein ANO11243_042110 [fungal sp. No.11243]
MSQLCALPAVPPEILALILLQLPDLKSLHAASTSCWAFNNALHISRRSITEQVLCTQIGSDVLPEAIAADETSTSTFIPSRQSIGQLMSHLKQRRATKQPSSLDRVHRMAHFHRTVQDLTDSFVNVVLTTAGTYPNSTHLELTPRERQRIERGFYLFQIYCNLFANARTPWSKHRIFFLSFAPWEVEQLSCIHDFLARLVSAVFGDVVRQDELRGRYGLEYDQCVGSPVVEHILSLGLTKFHWLCQTDSYTDRFSVLYSGTGIVSNTRFFPAAPEMHKAEMSEGPPPDSLDGFERAGRTALFPDPDPGPGYAYAWIDNLEVAEEIGSVACAGRAECIRSRGYVMRDNCGLFQESVHREYYEKLLYFIACAKGLRAAYMQNAVAMRKKTFGKKSLEIADQKESKLMRS